MVTYGEITKKNLNLTAMSSMVGHKIGRNYQLLQAARDFAKLVNDFLEENKNQLSRRQRAELTAIRNIWLDRLEPYG